MSSCVHVQDSAASAGLPRASSSREPLKAPARRNADGGRGMAALLLAAIVASMLVVADRLLSTTEEGGLLVAWVVLWGAVFTALALFAGSVRSLSAKSLTTLREGARRRAALRADQDFLAQGDRDPRVRSELQAIASHRQVESEALLQG